jgi:hypothetical protein
MLETVTRGESFLEVADLLGALEESGTATGGSSTTLVDSKLASYPADDNLNYYQLYIYDGTAQGDKRTITDFTKSSGTCTATAFSATPDTTSKYAILRPGWDSARIIRSINAAIRSVRSLHRLREDNSELVIGDMLSYYFKGAGGMEKWDNGAASAPNGYTAFGTSVSVARESSIIHGSDRSHLYSVKLTSNSTNEAGLRFSIPDYGRWAGSSFSVSCWIQVNTASRAQLRMSDGTTTTVSDAITLVNAWQKITIGSTAVADVPTQLYFELYITADAGGVVVAYFDDHMVINESEELRDYAIPSNIVELGCVMQESNNAGIYYEMLANSISYQGWRIGGTESNPRLVLKDEAARVLHSPGMPRENSLTPKGIVALTKGRHLQLIAMSAPAVLTSDDDNLPVNPNYVKYYAASDVAASQFGDDSPELARKLNFWKGEADRDKVEMNFGRMANGHMVRSN